MDFWEELQVNTNMELLHNSSILVNLLVFSFLKAFLETANYKPYVIKELSIIEKLFRRFGRTIQKPLEMRAFKQSFQLFILHHEKY